MAIISKKKLIDWYVSGTVCGYVYKEYITKMNKVDTEKIKK